ncbi:uncharacterized protein LOC122650519 [Telopea speciosissima]|uniref:uncharacterized protein LOC122650519 n=1 Tax=Telopea speciosissima TaxID=54955 RepID=UPI001CC5D7CD|nr:uncharacterized protein LOC122650519 [Telopea speciosissima]
MGNSLRCCLACVLPFGALDVIRIVHLNGHVEEITRPISAGEVLKENPNHVLSKPSSQGGVVRRILILSPESDLKRGNIYFLIPSSSLPADKKKKKNRTHHLSNHSSSSSSSTKIKKTIKPITTATTTTTTNSGCGPKDCDRYLTEILSEKKSSRRDRRSGRVSVWRPHLESISEDL